MNFSLVNVIWAYAVLLIVGGFVGFAKAGSKASLIASALCAVPLVLAARGVFPPLAAQIVAGFLMVFFFLRFSSSKKFMPAGLMAGVSLLALGLMLWMARS